MTTPAKGKTAFPLQFLIILLVVIGLAAVIYLPSLLQTAPPTSRSLQAAPGCDISRSSCIAQDDQLHISLAITSTEVRSALPLRFEADLGNLQADQVMLDLKGRDMYMGLNQVMLQRDKDNPARWFGETTLAVCTTGSMTWVASIVAEQNGQLIQADFEFDAR